MFSSLAEVTKIIGRAPIPMGHFNGTFTTQVTDLATLIGQQIVPPGAQVKVVPGQIPLLGALIAVIYTSSSVFVSEDGSNAPLTDGVPITPTSPQGQFNASACFYQNLDKLRFVYAPGNSMPVTTIASVSIYQ